MQNNILKTGFIILLLQSAAGSVNAETINNTALSESPTTLLDGGSLELGFGFDVDSEPMFIGDHDDEFGAIGRVVATYQWQGLFFEFDSDKSDIVPISSETLILGFNLFNGDNSSLDVIVGPEHGDRYSNDDDYEGIEERQGDVTGGLRATLYSRDYIAQLIARTDMSGRHNGASASALVGRNWQLDRFNLHANLKLGYASENMADYYLGVSSAEANNRFSEYHVGDAVYSVVQFGLAYPATKNWVLRAKTSVAYIADEIVDSPLLASNSNVRSTIEFTVNYVF
jgi:outer membrane scaffolding protein for murein synthesis (MipA/OmpV family)